MATVLDVSLKVLYVQGPTPDVDIATTEQLRAVAAELRITTIAGSAAALAELRRTPGWQALLASPSLPQNEILALITSLRRDRIPIAIVPIVDEAHQDLFASAVASGADDVLVRRSGTLVNVTETLTRIRQSPHLFPAEQRRRIAVLYAGRDPLVWNLLDQVPFVKAERVTVGVDGTCPVRRAGSTDNSLRADAVIIDEQPGEAHPLQVLKSVKAQASDLPVIMLTSAGAADIATAALELGADDTVLKTGIFRRRLIATLRRVHQRLELTAQQIETKTREDRLRQIVENVPTGIIVIAANGQVLAMNAAALHLFGAAKPRDIVGRDFRELVGVQDQPAVTDLLRTVTRGEPGSAAFEALTLDGGRVAARLDAVVLERDARGGRGVVASVTRAESRAPEPDQHAEELGKLQDSLQRIERHYAELEESRTREQAGWEDERRRLESRLEEAERLAAERASLVSRLDEVTAELARTNESFAAERQALEVRLQELETAAREASAIGATKAELERALAAVRDEQQQAIAAHELERSGWQAIRSELEARVHDLGITHEAERTSTIELLREDMRNLEQRFGEEREGWNATRQQLEAELRNAREALWNEHTERDAARAEADAVLTVAREEHERAQAAWHDTRETLEQSLTDARGAAEGAAAERDRVRADLQQEIERVRTALEAGAAELREAAEIARRELDQARVQHGEELQRARAELDREREHWQAQRGELEADLRTARDAEGAQRALNAVRSQLEAELEEARQQIALERGAAEASDARAREEVDRAQEATRAIVEEYDATRTRLEQERDEARQSLETERQTWLQERGRFEADLASQPALVQDLQQQWDDQQRRREEAWEADRVRLEEAVAAAASAAEDARQRADAARIDEAETHRQALEAVVQERDEARRRIEGLNGELEDIRNHAGDRDTLAAELDTARNERDEARRRIDTLAMEIDDARRQIGDRDGLAGALDVARRERDEARRHIETISAALEALRQQTGDRDGLVAALEAARNEIRHTDATHRTEREEWEQARQALEAALRDAAAAHATDRDAWNRTRDELEAGAGEAARLVHEQQRVEDALAALRADYAVLAQTLASERTQHDSDRREIEALRATIADADTRQADTTAALERAAQSAEAQLARQVALHEARVRELETDLRLASERLAQAHGRAEAARAEHRAEHARAWESHARLIASDIFGYAVTSAAGELVRCNEAFARLFGFINAAEAVARSAGRPFQPLVHRPEVAARLASLGRIEREESCVDRIDGRAVRIIESAVLIPAPDGSPDAQHVEHIVVAGPPAPTAEEIQGRRLQEVGALAAAMVPELESLVTSVSDRSADLTRRAATGTVQPPDVEDLRAPALRMAALVRQLAGFSRRQVRTTEPIDLADAVVAAEPVLSRLAGDYIVFSTDLGDTTPVTAQRSDLDQLLTSLATTARDLLPTGGSIAVRVRQVEGAPTLSVTASGYGMQVPAATTTLDLLAQRCGGQLRVGGEVRRSVQLEVVFPRCQ